MKWTLVKKITLYFAIIMLTVFVLLYFSVSKIMLNNNETTVGEEVTEMRPNVSTYFDQALTLRSNSIEEYGFKQVLPDIVSEMNLIFDGQFGIYSTEGEAVYSTEDERENREDIDYAIKGYPAYTIDYNSKRTIVHYSFPEKINGKDYIVRIEKDYSSLYSNTQYITNMVLIGSAVILFGALIVLLLLIFDVISPINRLSVAINHTAIDPEQFTPILTNRTDEIGKLAKDYNHMAKTIQSQMQTIESEKDNLNKTLEYRKAFFDNITHELKTPLTIIIGYAEMMEQTDFEDNDFNKKGINNIINESKRLRDMVTGLLESSRGSSIPEGQEQIFEVSEIIDEVVSGMKIKARDYDNDIICSCEKGYIKGSPDMLRQLIINLVDNAVKYGVKGKNIEIQAQNSGEYYKIKVCNYVNEEHVLTEKEKIFVPFYRLREDETKEAGSVGLGLAICKSIAIAHHGNIMADMEGDKAVFTVSIPKAKGGEED